MPAGPHETHHRSMPFGERAFAQIRAHRTTASPRGYEIWFDYALGTNAALRKAIDKHLRESSLTDEAMQKLYEQYVSPLRFCDEMESFGSTLLAETDELIAALSGNLGETTAYGDELDRAATRLRGGRITAADFGALVKRILAATAAMEAANAGLDRALREAQTEIVNLKTDLVSIRTEALIDPMTTLANRKAFDAALNHAFNSAMATGEPFSLLMVDIDHFKRFNDTFGHLTGDQVLRLVAQAVKLSIKGGDTAARFGGEEFAVILPRTAPDGAWAVAEQLRLAVMTKELVRRSTGETLGQVTVSVGIATYRSGDRAMTLIERADDGLYRAKRAGRNRSMGEDVAAPVAA